MADAVALASSRIKVLRLIGRLNRGGPSRQLLSLCRDLPASRFETLLACGEIDEGEAEDLAPFFESKVFVERIPGLSRRVIPWRDLAAYRSLSRLLRREKPEILHTHLAKAGVLGRLAAGSAPGSICVHTFHGTNFQGHLGSAASRASAWVERRLAQRTRALIAVSRSVREELLAWRIAPEEKIVVIPPGLDLEPYLAVAGRSGALRETLKMSSEQPLIGFAGRLVPVKNPMEFVEMAAAVSIALPQARFAVLGDGPLRASMVEMVESLGLRGRFYFAGWRSDMAACLADLDMLVCTSRSEGMPIGLIEAMAAGCFVVSRPVGGVAELLEQGRLGALSDPTAPDGLESEILQWLEKGPERREKTALARESVRARFAASRLLEDTIRLYEILLGGGSPAQFRSSACR